MPGAVLVADFGDAAHEFAVERVVEEIGEVVHHHDADGVDLAGAEQPSLGVGAVVAEAACGLLDPFTHLGADQFRLGEDVGGGALRNPGRAGHVRQFHAPFHTVIDTSSCEPIQFVD